MSNTSDRPSWDEYFASLADLASTRATCDRKHVGAVLVRDNRVLATGYNGSVRGLPHCDDAGHTMEDGHCVRTVHAEVNAVLSAARHGVSTDGATLYVNTYPCWLCFKMVANAGITRIVYADRYNVSPAVAEAAIECGVSMYRFLPIEEVMELQEAGLLKVPPGT